VTETDDTVGVAAGVGGVGVVGVEVLEPSLSYAIAVSI